MDMQKLHGIECGIMVMETITFYVLADLVMDLNQLGLFVPISLFRLIGLLIYTVLIHLLLCEHRELKH